MEDGLIVGADSCVLFSFISPQCILIAPWATVLVSRPRIPEFYKAIWFSLDDNLTNTKDRVGMTSHKPMLILENTACHDVIALLTIGQDLPQSLFIIFVRIVHWEMRNDGHASQRSKCLK